MKLLDSLTEAPDSEWGVRMDGNYAVPVLREPIGGSKTPPYVPMDDSGDDGPKVQASAAEDEPLDDETWALVFAFAELTGLVAAAEWNPRLHLRNRHGEFRDMVDRIAGSLMKWLDGGQHGDPLKAEFNREQLRRAAVKVGLNPKRGISEGDLRELFYARARERGHAAHPDNAPGSAVDAPKAPAKKAVKKATPTAGPGDSRRPGASGADKAAVDEAAGAADHTAPVAPGFDAQEAGSKVLRHGSDEDAIKAELNLMTTDQIKQVARELNIPSMGKDPWSPTYKGNKSAVVGYVAENIVGPHRRTTGDYTKSRFVPGSPLQTVGGPGSAGSEPTKAPAPAKFSSIADLRQSGLNPAAMQEALDLHRVDELKPLLKSAGLPLSGRKRDLVDRLVGHVSGAGAGATPAKAPAAPRAMSGRAPATPVRIHDMFTADDAAIDRSLRDVYEGKFGPYTTKVTVHITRAGTWVDKRGKEHPVEPSIGVDGKVYDENGHEIGYFGRSISPTILHYVNGDRRREVWAEHEIVQLGGGDYDKDPAKYHGKGFGGAFNRRAIDWYRASGVHGISQNDHNGYVWASQGFNFASGIMPEYKQNELRELISDLRTGRSKDKYGETIPARLRNAPDRDAQIAEAEALLARLATTKPGELGYPTAYEVSQLGRNGRRGKTSTWLGKHLKVPADEMILNPDEGEVVS